MSCPTTVCFSFPACCSAQLTVSGLVRAFLRLSRRRAVLDGLAVNLAQLAAHAEGVPASYLPTVRIVNRWHGRR